MHLFGGRHGEPTRARVPPADGPPTSDVKSPRLAPTRDQAPTGLRLCAPSHASMEGRCRSAGRSGDAEGDPWGFRGPIFGR